MHVCEKAESSVTHVCVWRLSQVSRMCVWRLSQVSRMCVWRLSQCHACVCGGRVKCHACVETTCVNCHAHMWWLSCEIYCGEVKVMYCRQRQYINIVKGVVSCGRCMVCTVYRTVYRHGIYVYLFAPIKLSPVVLP